WGNSSTPGGPITTTQGGHPITCGDTILLRGGATQTSAQGGAWRIDNGPKDNNGNNDGTGYYSSNYASPNAPITIRVATGGEWSGSNGDFVLDGTNVQATCLVFYCTGTHGLVFINDISNLILGG